MKNLTTLKKNLKKTPTTMLAEEGISGQCDRYGLYGRISEAISNCRTELITGMIPGTVKRIYRRQSGGMIG